MTWFIRWIVNALALLAVAYWVPGVMVDGFWVALLAAFVLGLVNALVRPILFVLTLPVTVLTLGLFALVVNAFMVWLASALVPGVQIDTFFAAMFAALILWIVGWMTNWFLKAE